MALTWFAAVMHDFANVVVRVAIHAAALWGGCRYNAHQLGKLLATLTSKVEMGICRHTYTCAQLEANTTPYVHVTVLSRPQQRHLAAAQPCARAS